MQKMDIRRLWRFDTTGLDAEQIRTLYLIIIAVFGGTSWKNITTGVAMTGYLKELGMSDFLYGIVMALPGVTNSFQFVVSYLVERKWNREKTFKIAGLIQRLSWIVFGLVPFLIPMSGGALRIWAAALLALLSAIMQPAITMNFMSICADVVPLRIRGEYFALRRKLSTVVALGVGLCVGALMDALPPFTNYLIIFAIAGLVGVMDISLFFFMKIPPMKRQVSSESMMGMVGHVFRNRNFMRLCLFSALSYFAIYLSMPYFTVYMNTVLDLSGMQMVTLHELLASAMSILVVGRWGRAMDRYGHKPMLMIATVLGAFVPLIWAFARPGQVWVAVLAQLLYGVQWCAVDMGMQNFYLEQAPQEGRTMYIAVYFLASQLLGIFLGSAAGGWLLNYPLAWLEGMGAGMTRYGYLFVISFALRLLAACYLPRVKEQGSTPLRRIFHLRGRV